MYIYIYKVRWKKKEANDLDLCPFSVGTPSKI